RAVVWRGVRASSVAYSGLSLRLSINRRRLTSLRLTIGLGRSSLGVRAGPDCHDQALHANISVGKIECRMRFFLQVVVANIADDTDDRADRIACAGAQPLANRVLARPIAAGECSADEELVTQVALDELAALQQRDLHRAEVIRSHRARISR